MRKAICLLFVFSFAVSNISPETVEEPEPLDWYLSLAEKYLSEWKAYEAIEVFEIAMMHYPEDTRPYIRLGDIYYNLNNFALSLEYFNRAVELDRNSLGAYVERAHLHKMFGNYEDALADHNMAIYLAPEDDDLYRLRGMFFRDILGNFALALADFNRAIELNMFSYNNFRQRGTLLAKLGHFEAALADLNQALTFNGESTVTLASRGSVFFIWADMPKHLRTLMLQYG